MKKISKLALSLLIAANTVFFLGSCSGPVGPQGPAGAAGAGISGANVNPAGHLILTMTNGQTLDAGSVVGPQGPAAPAFSSLVPRVEPSIVRIDVTASGQLESGSGTIIDKRGYIVTNAHVVNGGQSIKVTLMGGTTLQAAVVKADARLDLAIIKLNTTQTDFPAMVLGTSEDIVVGEQVMAMGFPMGTLLPGPATFTAGVISALREQSGATYIQTDTTVNPGNSGGCLFTLSGKMIGIPTASIRPSSQDFEDINFVIPINIIIEFIAQNVN